MAWHGPAFSRKRSISGNASERPEHGHRRGQGSAPPIIVVSVPRGHEAKRSDSIKRIAATQRSRHCRHRPKSEIPIGCNSCPAVPSSGTFVRLPASETLHVFGLAAFGRPTGRNCRSCLASPMAAFDRISPAFKAAFGSGEPVLTTMSGKRRERSMPSPPWCYFPLCHQRRYHVMVAFVVIA